MNISQCNFCFYSTSFAIIDKSRIRYRKFLVVKYIVIKKQKGVKNILSIPRSSIRRVGKRIPPIMRTIKQMIEGVNTGNFNQQNGLSLIVCAEGDKRNGFIIFLTYV